MKNYRTKSTAKPQPRVMKTSAAFSARGKGTAQERPVKRRAKTSPEEQPSTKRRPKSEAANIPLKTGDCITYRPPPSPEQPQRPKSITSPSAGIRGQRKSKSSLGATDGKAHARQHHEAVNSQGLGEVDASALLGRIADLEKRNAQLSAEVNEKNAREAGLQTRLFDMKQKLHDQDESIAAQRDIETRRETQHNTQRQEDQTEIARLEKLCEEYVSEIASIQNSQLKAEEQNEGHKAPSGVKPDFENRDQTDDIYFRACTYLQQQLDDCIKELQELKNKEANMKQREEEAQNHKMLNQAMEQDLCRLRQTFVDHVKTHAEQIESLEHECLVASQAHEDEVQRLSEETSEAQSKAKEHLHTCSELQQELDTCKKELQHLDSQSKQASMQKIAEHARHYSELKQARDEAAGLCQTIADNEEKYRQAQELATTKEKQAEERVRILDQLLDQAKEAYGVKATEATIAEAKAETLEKEIRSLRDEVSRHEEQLCDMGEEICEIRASLEIQTQRATVAEEERTRLEARLDIVTEDRDNYRARYVEVFDRYMASRLL